MNDLWASSKPWEWRTAFGATIYSSYEKPHTCYTTNMRGPAFILVTYFTPRIELIIFLNEWGKILPLRLEGQCTAHVTEDVRMI